jgi:nitrogen fixation-related uncharacterized protein
MNGVNLVPVDPNIPMKEYADTILKAGQGKYHVYILRSHATADPTNVLYTFFWVLKNSAYDDPSITVWRSVELGDTRLTHGSESLASVEEAREMWRAFVSHREYETLQVRYA